MRTPPAPCPHGVRAPVPVLYADQNDAFSRHVCLDAPFPAGMPILDGGLVVGASIRRMGLPFVLECVEAVGHVAGFQVESDPQGLHDRGAVALDRRAIWFVIDAYDRDLRFGSPAPDDPARTSRVLSILFPSDW